jgi:hypothetical protein
LKYDKKHPTAPRTEQDICLMFDFVNSIVGSKNTDLVVANHVAKQKKISGFRDTGNVYELTSGEVITTKKLIAQFTGSIPKVVSSNLLQKDESFLYSPQGLKSGSSSFRTDPYGGKVCAFDILFCRDSNGTRFRNLVLVANKILSQAGGVPTLVSKEHDSTTCPFLNAISLDITKNHFKIFCPYTERKQQRIYGEIPDLVIFDDKEIYVPRG